jgi:hypothetical protein
MRNLSGAYRLLTPKYREFYVQYVIDGMDPPEAMAKAQKEMKNEAERSRRAQPAQLTPRP